MRTVGKYLTAPIGQQSYISAPITVTAAPIIKQSYISAPIAVTAAPIIKQSYISAPIAVTPAPVYSAPYLTKSYAPQISPLAYTGHLSKVATYTPTSNIFSIPAVKQVSYQYPKITPGYLPPSPAKVAIASSGYTLNAPAYTAPIVAKYATSPAYYAQPQVLAGPITKYVSPACKF